MKRVFRKLVSTTLIMILLLPTLVVGAGEVKPEETPESTSEEGQEAMPEEGKVSTGVEVVAPSTILMEISTGKVICEKNADEQLPPASVTKVMTLLLIFDALNKGTITLEQEVTVSEHAAGMGGSQVYLEPGEKQTVDTMIKCITVASGNDACVAMAELVGGTEEDFVKQMNLRAEGLGMKNTHFVNCNGLTADGHVTTARDIGLMSCELMNLYPQIQEYTMIWMEDITHVTKRGSTPFGLSNTNKLVRHYEYTTGLKTGYTSEAKFCISATGKKDDVEVVAVIMGAPSSAERNKDAIALLNHGFANCVKYKEKGVLFFPKIPVLKGRQPVVKGECPTPFTYIDTTGGDLSKVEKKTVIHKDLAAPISKGMEIGEVQYYLSGELLGNSMIVATEEVLEMDFWCAMKKIFSCYLL